jgi:hypothetical protein
MHYNRGMTNEELKAILDRVLTWPPEFQEMAVEVLLDIEARQRGEPYRPSEEELAAIRQGLEQVERGEFASDGEVEAVFRRFDVEK